MDPTETAPASRGRGGLAFAEGTVLAERYRVVRFLARGGMGQVYEAVDLELGEPVALKTLSPELSWDEAARGRFRREIQLARRVTHPAVCRIFDLGLDGDTTFLTMELVAGETLDAWIARAAPVPLAEALPILRQIAGGLDAAHEAGVIHRDLKPGNVILAGGRAVITDFGLARAQERDAAGVVTDASSLHGSPAYMAPEQVEGVEVGRACDLYALGVLMFQLATGQLPFRGATALATALARLRVAPPRPSALHAAIDRRWEDAILRCLERAPARRFARAVDVIAALESPAAPRRPRRRLAVVAAALVAAGAAAVALVPRARPARPAVAVLGLANAGGAPEAAWIAPALSQLLTTELHATERLRLVPGETALRLAADLPAGDSFGADTLARIRERSGADYVVAGSYVANGGRLSVALRLQDARSGALVVAANLEGSDATLGEVADRGAARILDGLGVGALSGDEMERARGARPRDPRAARLHAEGLERLRRLDLAAARAAFEQAVALEPDSATLRLALSEALDGLGDDARAAAEAREAAALARGQELPRELALVISQRAARAAGDRERARALARELFRAFPDDVEHGLRLVEALRSAGDHAAARRAVAELLRLPPPLGDDPRVLLQLAFLTDDVIEKRAVFQRVRAASTARGERAPAAIVALFDAEWAEAEGQLAASEAAAAAATVAFHADGNRIYEVEAIAHLRAVHLRRGALLEALRADREALAVAEASGSGVKRAYALANLAVDELERGDDAAAAAALDAARRARDAVCPGGPCAADVDLAEAVFALVAGDAAAAERAARDGVARAPGVLSLIGARQLLAEALLAQGRLDDADAEAAAGRALLPTSTAVYTLGFDLVTARGKAARGDRAGALASLDGIEARLGERPSFATWADARQARGELMGGAPGRAVLDALAADAARRGWMRVSRRAGLR